MAANLCTRRSRQKITQPPVAYAPGPPGELLLPPSFLFGIRPSLSVSGPREFMGTTLYIAVAGALLSFGLGCASSPTVDAPGLVPAEGLVEIEQNPVFIPLGPQPEAYAKVFENVLQVLIGYQFEILESNRYDGRIETVPRVSPGLGLFFKPGSPDFHERLLSTLQTYRHRISVVIQPADNGGYFVEVIARKELQDLPKPIKQTAGAAVFRNELNVERQYEVIDINVFEPTWIYKGRDVPLEQKIIAALKKLM